LILTNQKLSFVLKEINKVFFSLLLVEITEARKIMEEEEKEGTKGGGGRWERK